MSIEKRLEAIERRRIRADLTTAELLGKAKVSRTTYWRLTTRTAERSVDANIKIIRFLERALDAAEQREKAA